MTDCGLRFYHGGASGRHVGDLLLPPSRTSARPNECSALYGAGVYDSGRVYVLTDRDLAWAFAVRRPGEIGALYRVEPRTPIDPDPDIAGLEPPVSFTCASAVVAEVLDKVQPNLHNCRRAVPLFEAFIYAGPGST